MQVRTATSDDVPHLDPIAFAAKAHGGYSAKQLAAWHRALHVPEHTLAIRPTFVAESDGRPVAFAQVDPEREPWELVAMWVLPAFMRKGIGRALLRRVCEHACACGKGRIAIDSDPNAAPFYQACGAQLVGHVSAPIPDEPARVRPQLILFTNVA